MSHFDRLPNEIVTQIFLSVPDIAAVTALASTCHRFHTAFHSSKKLLILREAADAEYGPIEDIVQLLTQNASQPAHIARQVPLSDALLHQVVKAGRVAQQYEAIYPFKKWKSDFANRRLLTSAERYALRRAIYRLWLFANAFHTPQHLRTARATPAAVHDRAALLYNYPTSELAELLDVHAMLRDLVANNICPSNGKLRQKFHKRFPDAGGANHHFLCRSSSIHLNYPIASDTAYHNSPLSSSTRMQSSHLLPSSTWHDPSADGWGDDITHYYVVEDMLKLDPAQLLYLREHCPRRAQVEAYLRGLGEWFGNNGETFSETVAVVVARRGGEMEALRAAVGVGELGVAVREED